METVQPLLLPTDLILRDWPLIAVASFDKDLATCQEYDLFKVVRRVEFPLLLKSSFISGCSMKLSLSRCRWGNVLNTNYDDLSGLRSMAEEIGRKSDGAPPSSADVPAVSENCQGDAACQKLLAESAGSIYKVRADHATGTGWVGPDGRLVTNYHVIMGKREITAEDNQGRVYRLGKDVAIDDVNDLAALGFVDGPPKGAKPLQIDTAPPKVGDQATLLSHRFGHSLELSQGTFSQQYTMADRVGAGDHRRHLEEQRAKWRTEDNPLNRDKDAYMSRTIYDFKIGGNHGSSGAPIFDKTGRVVSVVELQGCDMRLLE